jgi:hypothetical protein
MRVARSRAHGADPRAGRGALAEVRHAGRSPHRARPGGLVVHRHEQHLGDRRGLTEHREHPHAAAVEDHRVENEQVGPVPADQPRRCSSVVRLRDHLDVRLAVEQPQQRVGHARMGLGDDDSDRHAVDRTSPVAAGHPGQRAELVRASGCRAAENYARATATRAEGSGPGRAWPCAR